MRMLLVTTTIDTADGAARLGRTLVERGLVACAQISEIRSLYRWDGAVQDEAEFRLVLKSTRELYATLEAAIAELHPYDVPAIYAIEPAAVHAPFAEWIDAVTGH